MKYSEDVLCSNNLILDNMLIHVTLPWHSDIGALLRNNGIVQHLRFLSNATVETEGLSTSSMVTHATIVTETFL
jgi:hypothetical protein